MQLRGRKIPAAEGATDAAVPHDVSRSNGLLHLPPSPPSSPAAARPLSPLSRLYLYSLHGCLCELLFTAAWDLPSTRDVRLRGHSSLWALPMYALALLALEAMGRGLTARSVPLPLRLAAYTCFVYLWEFGWGAGLSLCGACPWDYSGFRYNFKGLITLEYAPFWAFGTLLAEKFVIKNTLRIRMQ